MTADQLKSKQVELGRAMREGRDAEAERLAVELALHFDALAEAEDRNPKATTPMWGTPA